MLESLIDCDLRDSGLVTRTYRGCARAGSSQSISSSVCVISSQEARFLQQYAAVRRVATARLRDLPCHKREDCGSLFGAKCARNESPAILASSLVAFRGEDRFRIGAGNFAHRNPANAAD